MTEGTKVKDFTVGTAETFLEASLDSLNMFNQSVAEKIDLMRKLHDSTIEFNRVNKLLNKAEGKARGLIVDKFTDFNGVMFPTNNAEARAAFVAEVANEEVAAAAAAAQEHADIKADLEEGSLLISMYRLNINTMNLAAGIVSETALWADEPTEETEGED